MNIFCLFKNGIVLSVLIALSSASGMEIASWTSWITVLTYRTLTSRTLTAMEWVRDERMDERTRVDKIRSFTRT